jgi:two-component system, chemotaxis family, chemotaxis protein CheY
MVQFATGTRRGTILLIEDRDDVRQGLAQLLELHGYTVSDAPDGQRALQQLSVDPDKYALIVLDLLLPGDISGHVLRQRQLADESLRPIPTIVITATELNDEQRAPLQSDAWLEKPFRFDALLGLVKRYVTPDAHAVGVMD